MHASPIDPAPITRHLRAKAGSWLLVSAVHHFDVFELLNEQPLAPKQLQEALGLQNRPAQVLFPALCAMGLLQSDDSGRLRATSLGSLLCRSNPENLTGYLGLDKEEPGVLRMTEWLKNDGPSHSGQGLSYVKDDLADSPMDEPEAAKFFTMALAGRARYLSPIVAGNIGKGKHLLDVAGGTGYYSYEWLLANPQSRATLADRPEVLNVAREVLDTFHGADRIKDRITFLDADMLTDDLPDADVVLAASLFHDWPEEICLSLANKFAAALRPGGELWVHDAFLNDTLDGPLAVTDYSAMLFLGTRGRAYSRKEYRGWLAYAGLVPDSREIPTLMDYGLICAKKPG